MRRISERVRHLWRLDCAGIVRERLGNESLSRLSAWFESPTGLDGGIGLLTQAPLFDQTLENLLRPLHEEQWGWQPKLHGAPRRQHALRLFGAGILAGCALLLDQEGQGAFPTDYRLETALKDLAAEASALTGVFTSNGTDFASDPAATARELVRSDPGLERTILACLRLASRGRDHAPSPRLRLVFLAGLLGAGVLPPAGLRDEALNTSPQ